MDSEKSANLRVPNTDFDVEALYAALDSRRRSRGLSWTETAAEVSRLFERSQARSISPSTLSGMKDRKVLEGDGILQILRWLDRTPESFISGYEESGGASATLPAVGSHQILRFDTPKMYAALNTQRAARGMTWTQVAQEIGGFQSAGLIRLAEGGRVGFPAIMRITRWLGRPAAYFTRASDL